MDDRVSLNDLRGHMKRLSKTAVCLSYPASKRALELVCDLLASC